MLTILIFIFYIQYKFNTEKYSVVSLNGNYGMEFDVVIHRSRSHSHTEYW